ncbi:MAG: preprotein translocase subunit SecG [Micavibrio sp.]
MENVILIIHLLLALGIIGLVLLQRSEGGGLGIGGGGGGMGAFAGAGATANALTRATAICAGLFFVTSLILGILAGSHHGKGSLLDSLDNPPAILDSGAQESDKDLPKAGDEPQPQSGAPSAPISE